MSYVTPVTDRSILDIQSKTAKGYFNLSDWNRIYGNAQYVSTFVAALFGVTIQFDTIATPTITSFGAAASINALLTNINRISVAANLPADTVARLLLSASWLVGPYVNAPDFNDLNEWEYIIDQMLTICTVTAEYWVHSGVAACGQTRFWQNRFRSY